MLSERHAINSWPQLSQYTILTAECDKQFWLYDTEFAVMYLSALTQGTSCLIIFQNLNTSACSIFSFFPLYPNLIIVGSTDVCQSWQF